MKQKISNHPNKQRSFAYTCAKIFVAYSVIFLLLLFTVTLVLMRQQMQIAPDLFDFLEYQNLLSQEKYQAIPMKKFPGCDFIILDRSHQVVYTTDQELSDSFPSERTDLVNNPCSSVRNEISTYVDPETYRVYTLLTQVDYQEEFNLLNNYCLLDEHNNYLSGTLFSELAPLTGADFNLIFGDYSDKQGISRFEYATQEDADRILLFFSRNVYKADVFVRNQTLYRLFWILLVPLTLLIIFLLTCLLIKKVHSNIAPLNQVILAYGQGKRLDLDDTPMPSEFYQVAKNFEQLLDQLESSRQQLQESQNETRRILADISHDIKTPLTVIQGYASALADGIAADDRKEDYIQIIYERSEHMADLVTTLVDYTRLEHPDFTLRPEQLDFCEYLRQYLADKYAEITLNEFQLEPDIPEYPIYASIDVKMMRRVLDNLISNSLRYNPPGTEILIQLQELDDQLYLTVADTGIGISDEFASIIFNPFVSGDQARAIKNGSGIGLTIVKKIVELHGGTISLKRPARTGYAMEFEIMLPKQQHPQ